MRPTRTGEIGDTHFDGATTWVCMGGTDWVDRIPIERDPCICPGSAWVTCLYHGDTTRLAGGKVLPWPRDWPIPEWDGGEHAAGDYGHRI